MWKFIIVVAIIVVLCFSVYAYNVRTNYNTNELETKNEVLNQDIKMLTYALSIVPKEIKNEVFYNSVKEKFPYIEEKDNFIGLIRYKEPNEKKGNEELKSSTVDPTFSNIFNSIVTKTKKGK